MVINNGLILCYGNFGGTGNNGIVNFPIAHRSAVGTVIATDVGGAVYVFAAVPRTITTFEWWSNTTQNKGVKWLSIGF